MHVGKIYAVALATALSLPNAALHQSFANDGARSNKSQYWLLKPTPTSLMREMTTDRPDVTEVPFTVDAGHIQIESTLFGYARSRPDINGRESNAYEFVYTNLRIGLTNDIELSLVWQPYGLIDTPGTQIDEALNLSGPGAVDIRFKINIWGNDDFDEIGSAFALLPFVVLPTDDDNGISAGAVEGGLGAFAALKLSEKLELGVNATIARVQNADGSGYHNEYPLSAALGYDWTDAFGTYVELITILGYDDPRGDILLTGVGFTYALTPNLQLDAGINTGLKAPSDRFNPFIGISARY